MATTSQSKLNILYTRLHTGSPITSAQLAELGISADLAVHYARSGWLKRLGRVSIAGPVKLCRSIRASSCSSGKSPDFMSAARRRWIWSGVRHTVLQRPTLHLYGWVTARMPDWFGRHFPGEYRRKQLFNEQPDDMPGVGRFENRHNASLVSTPERALHELLDEVGVRQPLQEAREIAESAYNLRASVLMELLKRCTSVKTVRLCLRLEREFSLPWVGKLDETVPPKGSARPWISKSKDGLLVLKP